MCNPIQFFKDITTDISTACNHADNEPEEFQGIRICSIVARILGSAAAIYTGVAFLTGISLIAGSPVAALALLVSTAIGVILAHDLIQLGCNQHNMIALTNAAPDGVFAGAGHVLGGLAQLGAMALREQARGTPFSLHNTWVFEPAYKLCSSCREDAENEAEQI